MLVSIMCGIIGEISNNDCNIGIYNGLEYLANRGQDSAGIIAFNGKELNFIGDFGTVKEAIPKSELNGIEGCVGVGHTKYGTTGDTVQPIMINSEKFNGYKYKNSTLPTGKLLIFRIANSNKEPAAITCNLGISS